LSGLSHKSSIAFRLTELFNIRRFKQASLHHGCASQFLPENLWILIAIYAAFTFFINTTPPPFCQKKVFGNLNLGSPEWQGDPPEK
jgi:hypothetical protein